MILTLRVARAVVSALIVLLLGIGFIPREAANALVALQKFLTSKIENTAGTPRSP